MELFSKKTSENKKHFRKFLISGFIILSLTLTAIFSVEIFALEGAKWANEKKDAIIYEGKTFVKATDQEKDKIPNNMKQGEVFIDRSNAFGGGPRKKTAKIITVKNLSDTIDGELFEVDVNDGSNFTPTTDKEKENESNTDKGDNSCNIEGGGGWAICMIGNTLAGMMDGLFENLRKFFEVPVMQTTNTKDNPTYQVWDYIKNIANICFVLAFLMIIYSHITGGGMSNYTLKKMAPRLLISAILVNVSYYICALMIDLSNVIGWQLHEIIGGIRKGIFNNGSLTEGTINVDLNWAGLVAAVLAGTGYGVYALSATTVGAAIFLAMSALLGVLYSAAVAFIVLAARQALIVVLIFLSPLAFVANILPNTEKWYSRWKSTFSTMLFVYPMISLLFAGSQLAGLTIIASAGDSILMLILGMTVQIIPLAITPAILKVSGSMLNRFAGLVNNKYKGPIDSTRRNLESYAMRRKHMAIKKGGHPAAKIASMKNRFDTKNAMAQEMAKNQLRANFENEERQKLEAAGAIDSEGNVIKLADGKARDALFKQSIAYEKFEHDTKVAETHAQFSNILSGLAPAIAEEMSKITVKAELQGWSKEDTEKELERKLGKRAISLVRGMEKIHALEQAQYNNKAVSSKYINESLQRSSELQDISAGVRGEAGKAIALAQSIRQNQESQEKEDKAQVQLFKQFNAGSDTFKSVINAKDGDKITLDNGGNTFEVTVSKDTKRALMEEYMKSASLEDATITIGKTAQGQELHDIRGAVVNAFRNAKKDDAAWLGGGFYNEAATKGVDMSKLSDELTKGFINKNNPDTFLKADGDSIKRVFYLPDSNGGISGVFNTNQNIKASEEFINVLDRIAADPRQHSRLKQNQRDVIKSILEDIEKDPTHKNAINSAKMNNIKKHILK